MAHHALELAAIRAYMQHIVAYDRQLALTQGLTIVGTEQEQYMSVPVPGIGTVRVGGVIDRIDRVGDIVRIVDYKTGEYKKDYDEQLHIYREAYNHERCTNDARMMTVLYQVSDNEFLHTVEPQTDFTKTLTDQLLEIMKLTRPTFVISDKTCKYCPYKLLCTSSTPRK